MRNRNEFQGARYEIATAAIIARAGFGIKFLDDTLKKERHCEFIATHKYTGIEIGVEAKSRHRKGVIHQEGEFNYNARMKGDVNKIYNKARTQKPENLPYAIFIDVNLPPTPNISWDKKPWVSDIMRMQDRHGTPTVEKPDPYNLLAITNFSYYYAGNEGITPSGEYLLVISKYSEVNLSNPQILYAIAESIQRYSYIPTEV